MVTVNMHQAKTHLSALVRQALDGESVVICRDGDPMVFLQPVKSVLPRDPLVPFPDLACLEVACDLTAPLDESEWPEAAR